jgi:cellulose synthase/poly-beta-1,6-N-acetylglucosamine synthase-like glycosyltransferase
MAPILLWLVMVLCLLISVVKYLMGIILKLSFPSTKIQKDYSYRPTVSVLMPCFNERRTVYETIAVALASASAGAVWELLLRGPEVSGIFTQ